jgi:hypothetical protein
MSIHNDRDLPREPHKSAPKTPDDPSPEGSADAARWSSLLEDSCLGLLPPDERAEDGVGNDGSARVPRGSHDARFDRDKRGVGREAGDEDASDDWSAVDADTGEHDHAEADASDPHRPTWAQYGFRKDPNAFSSSSRRNAEREQARLADLDADRVRNRRIKRRRSSVRSDSVWSPSSPPQPEIPAHGRPAHPTPLGERVLNLLFPLLEERIPLNVAILGFGHARVPGPTGRFLDRLALDLENGVGLVPLFTSHRKVFGDLIVEFLRSGEQTVGARPALLRYAQFRSELRSRPVNRHHDRIGATTRRFALTFGALLDVSGDVTSSLEGASIEMPRRLRKRLLAARVQIEQGSSLAEALPRRGFLSAGFEPRFIACVEAGAQLSALPKLLRAIALG